MLRWWGYLVFLVCAKALPATLLEALLYLPSFRILDAVEATDLLVCLVFAMNFTSFSWYVMIISHFMKKHNILYEGIFVNNILYVF